MRTPAKFSLRRIMIGILLLILKRGTLVELAMVVCRLVAVREFSSQSSMVGNKDII